MTQKEYEKNQEYGNAPLDSKHICFERGHSMYPVYRMQNDQSEWGLNRCSRCGWEDHWQYDFVASNPMYYKRS